MNRIDKIIGNVLGKGKKFGGKKDWDGDGVPNKKDCQPRNTMRQDIQNISTYKIRNCLLCKKNMGNNNYSKFCSPECAEHWYNDMGYDKKLGEFK